MPVRRCSRCAGAPDEEEFKGYADWRAIAAVKQGLRIPVSAEGDAVTRCCRSAVPA